MRSLTRRQFVTGAAGVGAAGVAGLAIKDRAWSAVLGSGSGSSRPAAALRHGKGVLVVVILYGGNDGLNTVIPYTDSRYLGGRPTLGYQPHEVLPFTDGLALHPGLKGMKSLWDAKQLAIVRGVGYPNPSRSHFRSMDIWQSASPDTPVATGWLGRWLDSTGSDPMRALGIGTTLAPMLRGAHQSGTAVAGTSVRLPGGSGLTAAIQALVAPGPERVGLAARVASSGADLLKVQHTLADLLGTGGSAGAPAAGGTAPAGGLPAAGRSLASPLAQVAELIKAGSPTRVYVVSMGGFDNHAQEKDTHARLMAELDNGISSFFGALKGHPSGDGTVLMTMSEFGRRVGQNASGGTDHGTAAPLFVAGPAVKGGRFYGDEPSLADLDQGDLKFTTDFRSVLATMLGPVLAVDPQVALGRSVRTLALV